MKTIVVYESLWGNTAAIARAIAEGVGPGAQALSTAEAVGAAIAEADLIVAGAPLLGFTLSGREMRDIRSNPLRNCPSQSPTSSVRSWLARCPGMAARPRYENACGGRHGGPAAITCGLEESLDIFPSSRVRFIVTGKYGPRSGELERARQWGTELAHMINQPDNARS